MTFVGTVFEFDFARGLGNVSYGNGTLLPFHCTAISDGSRNIEPGTKVTIDTAYGHRGMVEAVAVKPVEVAQPE